jgi:ATP-dependent exoDNAse (exonuclease V) alpha subunit
MPGAKIDLAARVFLSAHPEIDGAGEHWQAQRRMMDHLATGGRLGVVIGVPGSGKSFALSPLVQAWKDDGRSIYGISLAWRQAGDLEAAGITERASIAAFLKRVETGRYELDRNSVVVVDEVGLVGSRQMLDLLRIQERTGAQFVMVGDPRQAQPIEGAAGLELLRAALGDEAIPRLLYSTRQHSEREREIAALFRRGQAAEALEMKQEDGTALLVPGGREATVERVAELWRERMEAKRNTRDFTLSVSAPTNADTREIGAAIRAEWRRMGQLGEDLETRRAVDRTGEIYDITLAIGERLRLFDRIWDRVQHQALASNGDVVELRALRPDGMMVRNAAGAEGLVPWDKIRTVPDGPVRLAWGYALTVDTAQGSTATEHIHALPSGSQDTHGFKTYVAATRHREQNWIVIDEASERGQLDERRMIGHHIEVRAPDIWQNVAKNVARQPVKAPAISVVRRRA